MPARAQYTFDSDYLDLLNISIADSLFTPMAYQTTNYGESD
ncbi:MAG: hypothetical protein KatS3mg027_2530 [Bacteroidia bacterium]|nr:MAG: hypothetical protein KatS3mg027_2530 [Bacteroidia bacterium]